MGMRNIAKFVPLFLLLRKLFSIDCIDINQKPGNSKKKKTTKKTQNKTVVCGVDKLNNIRRSYVYEDAELLFSKEKTPTPDG